MFHVKRIPTHGGSIRVYAARAGTRPIDPSVAARRGQEREAGISDGSALVAFRDRVAQSKLALYALIATLKKPGVRDLRHRRALARVARSSTMSGSTTASSTAVMEISGSHKLDKYIPGHAASRSWTRRSSFDDQPEYALLLSWHIADELVGILRKKGYRGSFIVPLPEPRVIQ